MSTKITALAITILITNYRPTACINKLLPIGTTNCTTDWIWDDHEECLVSNERLVFFGLWFNEAGWSGILLSISSTILPIRISFFIFIMNCWGRSISKRNSTFFPSLHLHFVDLNNALSFKWCFVPVFKFQFIYFVFYKYGMAFIHILRKRYVHLFFNGYRSYMRSRAAWWSHIPWSHTIPFFGIAHQTNLSLTYVTASWLLRFGMYFMFPFWK